MFKDVSKQACNTELLESTRLSIYRLVNLSCGLEPYLNLIDNLYSRSEILNHTGDTTNKTQNYPKRIMTK